MIKWEVIVCAKEVINGEDLYDWEISSDTLST